MAMVSPSARPRPSMAAPTIPLRPKGGSTILIIPDRVPPSASAASQTPRGAWDITSRVTEATIGSTMRPTTMPAMNIDEPKIGRRCGRTG